MAESASTAVATAGGPPISAELQQLRDGALSLDAYLDIQVERAVSHLQGKVSGRRLELIKEVLREQMGTSPVLAELMKRASIPVPDSGTNGG